MFSTDFNDATQIYDILLLSYVLLSNNGGYTPEISSDFETHHDDYKVIEDIFAAFNETYRTQRDFIELKKSIEKFFGFQTLLKRDYFALIIAIDANCPFQYKRTHPFLETNICVNSLSNLSPNIQLFPIMEKTFATRFVDNIKVYDQKINPNNPNHGLRDRKDYLSPSINCQMNRFAFYCANIESYVPVLHYLTDDNVFMNHVASKGVIDIAVFPLISDPAHQIFNMEDDGTTFCIKGVKRDLSQKIKSKFQQSINLCEGADIDIAIFPEMLLTHQVLDTIQSISNLNSEILVAGSLWEANHNISHVFTNGGSKIFEQNKKTPFKYKEKGKYLEERLSLDDNIVHILDINGLGRFFVFICKDIDNEDLLNLVRCLHGDMVLLPAFSPSLDLLPAAKDLANRYHCVTIMSNACSPVGFHGNLHNVKKCNFKEIGFVSYPAKVNNRRKGIGKTYLHNQSCHNCNEICCCRKIRINFDNVFDDGSTLSPLVEIYDNLDRMI